MEKQSRASDKSLAFVDVNDEDGVNDDDALERAKTWFDVDVNWLRLAKSNSCNNILQIQG